MERGMSEFDLIRRYFTRATPGAELGVGDDAALLRTAPGMELVVSSDMLVAGTHFLPNADPFLLGRKALAVNLSDMAAMGAQPRWALLSLSLPQADEAWLQQFSAGFFALAEQYGVELVGGDTTRGPLNLCVTIMGEVPQGAALRRSGAQIGDDVWVSGVLGDAALALAHLKGELRLPDDDFSVCARKLHQPEPRVALGLALRGIAGSAIDVSDGLLADLGHILESSGVGAELDFAALPVSSALRALSPSPSPASRRGERGRAGEGIQSLVQHCALAGGDDYELCFTAPVSRREAIQQISRKLDLPLTRIGTIVPKTSDILGSGCTVHTEDGRAITLGETGYDHFA
jgi:thiamine-monophosphate kinase